MASGADAQLPSNTDSIPDRECTYFTNRRRSMLTLSQPFVSTIGIFWTAYLSMTNSAEDETILDSPTA